MLSFDVKNILTAVLPAIVVLCLAALPAVASLETEDEFNGMKIVVEKPEEIPEASKADAEYNLGVKYFNAGNAVLAAGWFRKAAEHGEVQGQSHLGLACEMGLGVKKDYKEAIKWYSLAAAQNDHDSWLGLGRLYAHGRGVKRDDVIAAKWFRLAADHGMPHAQYALGLFYHAGRGVQRDEGEAYFWLALASKTFDSAMKTRDEVAKLLPDSRLQAIRLRLLQWKPME